MLRLTKEQREEYQNWDALFHATEGREGRLMTLLEKECFKRISELEEKLRDCLPRQVAENATSVWKAKVARLEARLAKAEKLAEAVRRVLPEHPEGYIPSAGAPATKALREALSDFEKERP